MRGKRIGAAWFTLWVGLALAVTAACSTFDSDGAPTSGADGGDRGAETAPPVQGTPAPPFDLSLKDGKRVELVRGKRVDVSVVLERRDGFNGEVVITVTNLPDGVAAEPLTFRAGSTLGTLGLIATSSVAHALTTAKLHGAAREGNELPNELTFDLILRGDPGSLDETFGKKGVVELTTGPTFAALDAQADGKVLYAGSGGGTPGVVVGRLQANGLADTGFGMQGTRRIAFGAGADEAAAVFAMPDGKVTVVGTAVSEAKVGVARLTAAGTLDPTFAGTGTMAAGTGLAAVAARPAPDGSVYVLARAAGFDVAVGHVKATGQLDTIFGSNGWLTIPKSAFASAVRLVASDIALNGNNVVVSFAITRNGSGSTVGLATFSNTGQGATPVYGETYITNISQEVVPLVTGAYGTIVAFNTITAGPEAMVVYQYATNGKDQQADRSYAANDYPFSIVEDATHRLLVAGMSANAPRKFRLLRVLPDLTTDPAFGAAGVSETLVGEDSRARRVAIQKDGRILVGGDRTAALVQAIMIARYWP